MLEQHPQPLHPPLPGALALRRSPLRAPARRASRSPEPSPAVLRYPASWRTAGNPRRFEVGARVGAWLRAIGVIEDETGAACFEALAASGYGGWPFARADAETLETMTRFLTLWIFEDDRIEGLGKQGEDELVAAVRGEPETAPAASGLLRGWWETARRYRGMGEPWLDRHAERFRAWLGSVQGEAEQVRRYHQTGEPPTLAQYLEVRRVNVGVLPTLDLLEHTLGRALSEEALRHPALRAIEREASEAVALINDLFGFSKDRAARWLNAVSCLAADEGLSTAAALRRTAIRHNACVRTIERLGVELERALPGEPLLGAWLEGVGQMVYGFARWHAGAPRYAERHAVEGGGVVRLLVR